jgi:hypothetical protein
MLVGVWKDSLLARVVSDEYEFAAVEPHVREFDITGKPLIGWVLVEHQCVADNEQSEQWNQRALKLVRQLPAT